MADRLQPSRRGFLRGAAALFAAPAIIRVASLMPVRAPALQAGPTVGYSSIMEELSAITRRAFVPRLFIQIYRADPIMAAMTKHGDDLVFNGVLT